MPRQLAPGMRCKVIDSSVGKGGASVGRIVRIASLSEQPIHERFGVMWDCEPADGKGPFMAKMTAPDLVTTTTRPMNSAAFADNWLEPLETPPEPPKVQTKEVDLVN